jgi:hypothetical protein
MARFKIAEISTDESGNFITTFVGNFPDQKGNVEFRWGEVVAEDLTDASFFLLKNLPSALPQIRDIVAQETEKLKVETVREIKSAKAKKGKPRGSKNKA